jgi:hypothetical protein
MDDGHEVVDDMDDDDDDMRWRCNEFVDVGIYL